MATVLTGSLPSSQSGVTETKRGAVTPSFHLVDMTLVILFFSFLFLFGGIVMQASLLHTFLYPYFPQSALPSSVVVHIHILHKNHKI